MSGPVQPAPLLVGVALAPCFERRGDSLADARAFEAAGCDSLWLTGDEDPWVAAAAIAVVTARVRLIVPVTAVDPSAADFARRTATMRRLSAGRFGVCCTAELLHSVRAVGPGLVFCTLEQVVAAPVGVDGLVVPETSLPGVAADTRVGALWLRCAGPTDRSDWRQLRARCQQRGAVGVVVPQAARFLDMLRNPDQDGDRSDLHLAHG